MQDMPIHARDATFFAQDWPRSVASYQFFIDRKHRDARICFASGAGRQANCDGAAPAAQSCDAPRFRTEKLYAGMRACGRRRLCRTNNPHRQMHGGTGVPGAHMCCGNKKAPIPCVSRNRRRDASLS
ncbi:hypothetical protein XPU_3199 [Xanthomonas arboricola pv. pruni str. MAFF 311562]|uniref:Uncharacterized protein n=1 Tax=Xanthomonas arboricola pv. pruni str. MAFF 311562 TaxID=1414836 RepID=W4S5L2_9XANT|nr:hypothetical protein XPU_3199 [Xanthomonas arboricola pv. pruni str. MAFF 311562]GAE58594.1 hypothetical protein XPN_0500 [Xanthomonas arboricola pv. pruni MAFF 301427]